MQNYDLVNL